jgi:histidinol dehydrogenase
MTKLNLRRIRCSDPDAAEQLSALRKLLSPQGDVVSQQGKELTESVFGETLPPVKVVEGICADVRARGLAAVLHYSDKFDRAKLDGKTLRVPAKDLSEAHKAADGEFLDAVKRVKQNVLGFQLGLIHTDAVLSVPGSHELRLRYRPLRRVGICIPGGAAAYPSTLLMTVCPAQAAGVKQIAVVMPPTPNGAYNKDMLAVCHELGVTEVYRVGGAQAVAALAYGIEGLPAVDMIVGPGNLFVTLAKRQVFGHVAIDMLAGPSEIIVLADESATPAFVAADLIAQAEHSPGSSILISWHAPLLDEVPVELERQLAGLPRGDLARDCLERFGALLLAADEEEAIDWTNQLAPEHVHIATRYAESLAEQVTNAGAVFVGHYSPVALGDYVAGPSHVLPTGGTARFASGLSANDFQRRTSVLTFAPAGLRRLADDVRTLAEKEGLTAHAASIDVRLDARPESNGKKPGSKAVKAER